MKRSLVLTIVALLLCASPVLAQETPTFTVRGEWAFALEIAKVVMAGIIAGIAIWRGGDALQVLDAFIRSRIADKQLNSNLTIGFNRLTNQNQESIRQLVEFADPFTDFTATDLDDKVVVWLQGIVNQADGEPQG